MTTDVLQIGQVLVINGTGKTEDPVRQPDNKPAKPNKPNTPEPPVTGSKIDRMIGEAKNMSACLTAGEAIRLRASIAAVTSITF